MSTARISHSCNQGTMHWNCRQAFCMCECHARPDFATWAVRLAQVASERSTCPRAAVGAVILNDDHHLVGLGYNGAPPGEPHCTDPLDQGGGCDMTDGHCQRAIHAEVNAVAHATGPLKGATLYLYSSRGDAGPCRECRKVLTSAGVRIAEA